MHSTHLDPVLQVFTFDQGHAISTSRYAKKRLRSRIETHSKTREAMKVVLQKVSRASVTVESQIVSAYVKVNKGSLVLDINNHPIASKRGTCS